MVENQELTQNHNNQERTKFCKYCGAKIHEDAVMCTYCGRQVEQLKSEQPQVVVNNTNANTNVNRNFNVGGRGNPRNKWVALALCVLLGWAGGHKFYEGKAGMGLLYLFTWGLFGIGILVDFITILCRPNPYYV